MIHAATVKSPSLSTIMAASVVAWVLFAVLHEIVGHGAIALLLGEDLRGAVSTTVHIADFYDLERVAARIGWWGFRAVAAGGTFVNFAAGAVAILLLASRRIVHPATRYFLWYFATVSIVQQAFWLSVMPFAALGGDWTAFFIGLESATTWKAGVTTLGIALLWLGYRMPLRAWAPDIAEDRRARRRQIRRLTIIPVLTTFAVQLLSVAWSPLEGPRHTTIVSVFSFIPLLLWLIPANLISWPGRLRQVRPLPVTGSRAWLVAGLVAFVVFVFVLGTGIGTFEGHPDYPE